MKRLLSLPREVGWVGSVVVWLAMLSSWDIPQATVAFAAEVDGMIERTNPAMTIIVVPNHATYEVSQTSFILGDNRLFHARAPFGSGGGCPLQSTINSSWPVNSTMALHVEFELLRPGIPTVFLSVNNDVVTLSIAGNPLVTDLMHEGCPVIDEYQFTAGFVLPAGRHGVDLVVRDRGAESYFDMRVEVELQ